MRKNLFEIFLTQEYVNEKSWLNFILAISRLNGIFRKWTIWIKIENNYVRYFIETKREIPSIVNELGEFLVKKVEEDFKVTSIWSIIPCFITKGYKNILELYDKKEAQKFMKLKLTKINIYPHKKDNYLSTTRLFLEKENKVIVQKKAFFNDVYKFLSINFDKHVRFFYKKDEEKYLDIRKTMHLLNSEKNNAVLKVNAFPYFKNDSYLNQKNYDFAKHTLVVGASGTGKSKLMSTFIKNISNNIQDKLRYKVIVIDPHAAIEEDIGGLDDTTVIDFKSVEDSIDLFINSREDIIATTESIMSLFKTIIADQYNSKLERVLRYSIHILLAKGEFNFINLRKLLIDTDFRTKILKKLENKVVSSVIEFFYVDFNGLKTNSYQEAISPIISFIDEMQILPVFNNKEKISNMQDIIDGNFLTILSLDQTTIGEKITKTIAGFSMQQILQLVQAHTFEEHIILVVDEVSVIENPILCRFLSESRKYNLSIILCQQYFGQISNELQKAILTNIINYFIFRVSRTDAVLLESNMKMEVAVHNSHSVRMKMLTELSDRECIARVSRNGTILTAFKGRTLDLVAKPRKKKNKLVEKNNLSNEVINKIKGKFSIENAGDIKDIMVSQSSARKKVNNSG